MAKKRKRVRLWTPVWEGPTKNWALSFIVKNKWRCDLIHDVDDLLQDAYMIFERIEAKYPYVDNQAHFMTLFRRSLRNYIHDKSRYVMHKAPHVAELPEHFDPLGELDHNGYLNVLLSQAPPELRQALDLLEHNPEKFRNYRPTLHRENLNMKLRRILKLKDTFDFTGTLRALLSH